MSADKSGGYQMFDSYIVRVLTMWVASGIAAFSLLLLSLDTLTSGDLVFDGIKGYALLLSPTLPLIAAAFFCEWGRSPFTNTVMGLALGVFTLGCYGYFMGVSPNFIALLAWSVNFAVDTILIVLPMILGVNLIGYGINVFVQFWNRRRRFRS